MSGRSIFFLFSLTASAAFAQHVDRLDVGRLENGATVSFLRTGTGEWGIEISGGTAPRMFQLKPAQVEIFRSGKELQQLAAAYQSVEKNGDTIVARGRVAGGPKALFDIEDRWHISGAVLSLSRNVNVASGEERAGFSSAIRLSTDSAIKWEASEYFAPGLLYGEPHTSPTAPGGDLHYRAKTFSIREDDLSAPLFGVVFRDGSWVAALDLAPNGETTMAESSAPAATPVVDEHLQFGALGAREASHGGVEIGFWLPGTTEEYAGGFFGGGEAASNPTPVVRRRYHPLRAGFSQVYRVGFRFGKSESFRDMERESWRWAWQSLNPRVTSVDVEVVRRTLTDHLADRVLTVEDRAGVPFVIDAVSGRPGSYRPPLMLRIFRMPNGPPGDQERRIKDNEDLAKWAMTVGIDMDPKAAELELWPKIMMGFCGKNVEVADQLLQESDRDSTVRGRRMRKLGMTIIESLIRIVPMSPPAGEGFDIRTGKASAVRGEPSFSLRALSEDMRTVVDMFRRERALGRLHPKWLDWARAYADFLLTQQRQDGSFPETWQGGTGVVRGTSGVTSYSPVPLLVRISEETGEKKYLSSAIAAGEYIWTNFGSQCVYLGATGGGIADKESGMLSLEAFLALYENTKDPRWLQRAETAGSYTESWIWIWNVPMPLGANPSDLGWKPGVPTVGVNGIGSNVAGGVDEYLDWAVASYARLYKYSNDPHDLDVARVLLHDTKSMLALPGRTYDLLGPGWQQEHWRMGPDIRGIGAHRTWLPWISVNHLHGITALEEFDPILYRQLSQGH